MNAISRMLTRTVVRHPIATDPMQSRAEAWSAAWKLIDLCEISGEDTAEVVAMVALERDRRLAAMFTHRARR
jgi:hypothetical protein